MITMRKMIEKIAKKLKGKDYSLDRNIPCAYLADVAVSRILMYARGMIVKIWFGRSGKMFFVGKEVKLKCKWKIKVGNCVSVQDYVCIDALSREGVRIGNNCSIGSGTIIRCSGNMKEIGKGFFMGNDSSLGDNCFVGATGGVFIGNDVIGGQNIRFHSSNHNFDNPHELIRKQGVNAKGIRVGNNCWIGAGVVFCDGVSIGNGCVIGANSVVTKSFPDNSVIVGNPAKRIKNRIYNT